MTSRRFSSRSGARVTMAVLAAAALAAAAGCSSSSGSTAASGSSSASASASASSTVSGSVTVVAASSLKAAFTTLGAQFHAANPGATVTFNFGGSATLAQQITAGAPADVFAAASSATMKTVTTAGDAVGTPSVFAHNQLEIAVAPGNPKNITSLSDLTKSGLKVVLCAVAQPCGAAAATVIKDAKVSLTPVSLEADVASALTKVELGEADAALVYKTDVQGSAGKVTGVDFTESSDAINTYPITVLTHAPNSAAAAAFVGYVLSAQGQAVLAQDGFAK
jgi:molybdate transport system substrate-binding protein